MHCFGSYYWNRGDWLDDPTLGEPIAQPRPFYEGEGPPIAQVPRICGPIEYFTQGDPNGPQVGLPTCLGLPEGTSVTFPAIISDATGAWSGYEGATATFQRLPGPHEEWTGSFAGPGTLSLVFQCDDSTPLPPGVHYALFITNPIFEFVGFNSADSWYRPVKLVFVAVSAFGSFTLTVGDLPVAGEPRVWGILPCCMPGPVPQQPSALSHFDLTDQGVLYMLAAITASTYEATGATALSILTAWCGSPTSFAFVANGGALTPGTVIAVYPGFALVFASGTTDELQLALQVMQSTLGPVDCGAYSTVPIWRVANRVVHGRLQDMVADPDYPVLLVGHSYGGALAWTLAADYLVARPFRQVRCITFGCPKPGDDRLASIADRNEFRRVENYGDPVPAVPPDFGWLSVFAPVISKPVIDAWALFVHGGTGLQVQVDGKIEMTANTPAFYSDMLVILANFGTIIVGLEFTRHLMTTYATRLDLGVGAPLNPFPVSPAALAAARAAYP